MRRAWLLVRKDLLVLARSRALLGVLLAYPLLIALLIGLAAGYATAKPRVALVDLDGLPRALRAGSHVICVPCVLDEAAETVRLVPMGADEADRALADGRVVGSLTVPRGFTQVLRAAQTSPSLLFQTASGGVAPRVEQQMEALVYRLNRRLEQAYIDSTLSFVDLIQRGGRGSFLGRTFEIIGLAGTERLLDDLPRTRVRQELGHFVDQAQFALGLTGVALRATANPVLLERERGRGRTWALSAPVRAYGLALTVAFLAFLLAAGATAAERDENVAGRLVRGLVRPRELVAAKVALAVLVAGTAALAVALAFGIAVEIGGAEGGEPWQRLPLLAAGLALAAAAVGALGVVVGVLAREGRTASLVAVLVVLPIVFLGLVPREIVPPAGWLSEPFPFVHSVRFLEAVLDDPDPWGRLGVEAAWLAGIAAVAVGAAVRGTRRLSA
jgi:ABC-2 type transport system permease protein